MPKFKKPPGPPVVYAVVRNGQVLFWAPEATTSLPKRYEVVPYVPEWKKAAAEAEYRSLLEAGERETKAFEDALVAVKLLADYVESAARGVENPGIRKAVEGALAKAKELAPGAWIIKREEIREAEDG